MEELDLLFYSVEKVAERWKKPVNSVWQLAAKGELELIFWYAGLCIEVGKRYGEKMIRPGEVEDDDMPFISQWVGLVPTDALQFAVPPYVDYVEAIRVNVNGQGMMPVDTVPSYNLKIKSRTLRMDRDSVVVATEEIVRMEAKYPKLSREEVGHAGKNKKDEFHPAEKKSLLKITLAMATGGYGYDPDDKKSPIPVQIVSDAAAVGYSISDDTVRKYLKEAAKLKKDDI